MSPDDGEPSSSTINGNSSQSFLSATSTMRVMYMDCDFHSEKALVPFATKPQKTNKVSSILRSLLRVIPLSMAASCRAIGMPAGPSDKPSLGSRVTGTLYGHRRGHVHFVVQEDSRAQAILLLELATSMNSLVKEMASGLVRIAMECERTVCRGKLFHEPIWTIYCNGQKTGYAMRRNCAVTDSQILGMVQAISMGAGEGLKGDSPPPFFSASSSANMSSLADM